MAPPRGARGTGTRPGAVGVLAPPGRPTVLIVRPHDLPWDLLLTRGGESGQKGTPFLHLDPEDAAVAAEGLVRAWQRWAAGGPGSIEEAPAPDGDGFWVQALLGSFPLLACPRQPGRPYRPAAFARADEARAAAWALADALRAAAGTAYVNTRHFERPAFRLPTLPHAGPAAGSEPS